MKFTSDNASGVAPEIMAALSAANDGAAGAYGGDPWPARTTALILETFDHEDAAVFLVATGAAANALALSAVTPVWGSILCHRQAHVEEDECGAPEFYIGGGKLALLDGDDAKSSANVLTEALRKGGGHGVHSHQPRVLSLTQATEAGALYSADEVAELAGIAHGAGLRVHMDGTRFSNAIARTNHSPAEMSWKAGVDILCLGATKCGAMAAEAVVVFDPGLADEIAYRRKRGGHLFSKMRFVSAQMEAWLKDGLWLRLAGRANAMADRLAEGLRQIPSMRLAHPVEANMMFVEMEARTHQALRAAGADYYLEPAWQDEDASEGRVQARLVCSFATTPEQVDEFLEKAQAAQ
ncbi:MAG: threonine aldolase family protein [Neomegalonema sp.]